MMWIRAHRFENPFPNWLLDYSLPQSYEENVEAIWGETRNSPRRRIIDAAGVYRQ